MEKRNKAWTKFIVTMIIFIVGMILMILNHVSDWRIWLGYIALWTIVESIVAKEIKLKWWVWLLIIAVLSIFDIIIIKLIK